MSIATEIARLKQAKDNIKEAIEAKGVTVSSSAKLDTYSSLIEQISQTSGTDGNNYTTTVNVNIDGGTVVDGYLYSEDPIVFSTKLNTEFVIDFSRFFKNYKAFVDYQSSQENYSTTTNYTFGNQPGARSAIFAPYLINIDNGANYTQAIVTPTSTVKTMVQASINLSGDLVPITFRLIRGGYEVGSDYYIYYTGIIPCVTTEGLGIVGVQYSTNQNYKIANLTFSQAGNRKTLINYSDLGYSSREEWGNANPYNDFVAGKYDGKQLFASFSLTSFEAGPLQSWKPTILREFYQNLGTNYDIRNTTSAGIAVYQLPNIVTPAHPICLAAEYDASKTYTPIDWWTSRSLSAIAGSGALGPSSSSGGNSESDSETNNYQIIRDGYGIYNFTAVNAYYKIFKLTTSGGTFSFNLEQTSDDSYSGYSEDTGMSIWDNTMTECIHDDDDSSDYTDHSSNEPGLSYVNLSAGIYYIQISYYSDRESFKPNNETFYGDYILHVDKY